MKQQVFVIHGGNAFNTYDEYIAYLRGKVVDLDSFSFKGWKSRLQERLGDNYEVYPLRMPNGQNAKYLEWMIWFEKYIPFMQDGVILVGHSLGGVFLAKYLSENSFPKKIKATYMVAAPYNEDEGKEMPEFSITHPLRKLEEQGGKLFIYHSKDDPVVAFTEMEKYKKELPKAIFRIFEDKGHFNMEEFPEIVEDIKVL
jgi:predicted alpha/beta hydrolase family esterase